MMCAPMVSRSCRMGRSCWQVSGAPAACGGSSGMGGSRRSSPRLTVSRFHPRISSRRTDLGRVDLGQHSTGPAAGRLAPRCRGWLHRASRRHGGTCRRRRVALCQRGPTRPFWNVAVIVETFWPAPDSLPARARRLARTRETIVTLGHGCFPDGFAFDDDGGIWIASLVSNRLLRSMTARSRPCSKTPIRTTSTPSNAPSAPARWTGTISVRFLERRCSS